LEGNEIAEGIDITEEMSGRVFIEEAVLDNSLLTDHGAEAAHQ